MTIEDILLGSGGALLGLLTILEITPIRINPWSRLMKWIGRAINKEVSDKLDKLDEKVDSIEEKVNDLDAKVDLLDSKVHDLDTRFNDLDGKVDELDKKIVDSDKKSEERDVILCRARMLRFGDEILHDVKHSKDHFDQILLDCTTYENYCKNHPGFLNDITGETIGLIKSTYKRCMEEKSFL